MHATCTPRGKRLQPCERVDAHAQRGDLKIREVIAHFRLSFFATSSTRAIDDRLLRDLVLAATDSRSPLSCPTVLHEREGGDGDSHSDEGGRGKVMIAHDEVHDRSDSGYEELHGGDPTTLTVRTRW